MKIKNKKTLWLDYIDAFIDTSLAIIGLWCITIICMLWIFGVVMLMLGGGYWS